MADLQVLTLKLTLICNLSGIIFVSLVSVTDYYNSLFRTIDMDENFSPRVKDVISYSKEEAIRLGT